MHLIPIPDMVMHYYFLTAIKRVQGISGLSLVFYSHVALYGCSLSRRNWDVPSASVLSLDVSVMGRPVSREFPVCINGSIYIDFSVLQRQSVGRSRLLLLLNGLYCRSFYLSSEFCRVVR